MEEVWTFQGKVVKVHFIKRRSLKEKWHQLFYSNIASALLTFSMGIEKTSHTELAFP